MTAELTPNTQITQANVGLLKAGDWLRHEKYGLCQFFDGCGGVGQGWALVECSDGKDAGCRLSNLTYIGPDLGDGWIGWSGGENPVPGMRVEVRTRGTGIWSDWLSDQWGTSWLTEEHEDLDCADAIIAFRPALSPPAEGEVSVNELLGQISDLCTSFNDQIHDADDVLGQINQLAYRCVGKVRPDLMRDALEKIAADGEPYRNGYCQTDFAVDPALTAQEAQDVARSALMATPTPTPVDHIGDATEKVDWNVVGPKLVEAVWSLIEHFERVDLHDRSKAVIAQAQRAALAAQPERQS